MSKRGMSSGKRNTMIIGRRAVERIASLGLILVAVGMACPFIDLSNSDYVRIFKWVYAAGALIYTVARVIGSNDPADSMRIRRLRRMEFWAGVAFCVGAFFWFYNEERYALFLSLGMGQLACLRDTIYFSLAGALIQVIAVFAMSRRMAKEKNSGNT